jgi:hypothetical protein
MPPDSPFPGSPTGPPRPISLDRKLLEQAAKDSASAARCVHRIEEALREFILASVATKSVPPMRAPMHTHPGIGADSSSGFAAPTEQAIERVLDGRELKAERDRKDMIKAIVIASIAGAGAIGLENLARAIFAGHH